MKEQTANNVLMLKALEEIGQSETAVLVVSDPNLDGRELSELLECSIMGKIKYKDGTPLKLSNTTVMAGIRNRMQQLSSKL